MKTKLIIIIYFLIFNCSIHEFQINNESINIENIELKSKISTDFEDITKNKILYNDN